MATQCTLMLSGMPGEMCVQVAKAAMRRGVPVAKTALSGPEDACPKWMRKSGVVAVEESGKRVEVQVVGPDEPGAQERALREAKAEHGDGLVVVDFTHPSAVNVNADMYVKTGVDFVMGTTGGNRELLNATAEKSSVYSVIAPNFNKQVVALQLALKNMSTTFPGLFNGYFMQVTESHPETKTDGSVIAEDITQSFQAMGISYHPDKNMKALRKRADSASFGVPAEAMHAHSFHTYDITSRDGTSTFKLEHNSVGGEAVAEGAVDAALFLLGRKSQNDKRNVFDMHDILGVKRPSEMDGMFGAPGGC